MGWIWGSNGRGISNDIIDSKNRSSPVTKPSRAALATVSYASEAPLKPVARPCVEMGSTWSPCRRAPAVLPWRKGCAVAISRCTARERGTHLYRAGSPIARRRTVRRDCPASRLSLADRALAELGPFARRRTVRRDCPASWLSLAGRALAELGPFARRRTVHWDCPASWLSLAGRALAELGPFARRRTVRRDCPASWLSPSSSVGRCRRRRRC